MKRTVKARQPTASSGKLEFPMSSNKSDFDKIQEIAPPLKKAKVSKKSKVVVAEAEKDEEKFALLKAELGKSVTQTIVY